MEIAEVVSMYSDIISYALPILFVFWLADFGVTTVLKAAFGGKFDLKTWE